MLTQLSGILCADGDDSPIRHRIAGIHAQVQDHEFELGPVDLDRPQVIGEFGLHLHIAAERAVQQFSHAIEQPVQIDRFGLERLAPRECEQLPAQRGAPLGCLAHLIDDALLPAGVFRPLQKAQPPDMTMSRLLKSWATPPVSCPIASIFCVWRMCFSASASRAWSRIRAVTSYTN